uniref:Uncharacterized protein n=1 Tax=Cebus imitator TaxID=2715852 RepID=A0A2K5QCG7_CEBIM
MLLSHWVIPSASVVGRESAAEDKKVDMGVYNNKKGKQVSLNSLNHCCCFPIVFFIA